MDVLWLVLAGLGFVALVVGLRRFISGFKPASIGERLPATPLQRLGVAGLWVTSLVSLGLVMLLILNGAEGVFDNDVPRYLFWLFLLVGMAAWFAVWRSVGRATGRVIVDERDRDILARSFTVESLIVILSLVAWVIGLTEAYRDQGAVPLDYLQLLFWSTFILGAFGRSLGIVLGYHREPAPDA
jgi:hypothetical protein